MLQHFLCTYITDSDIPVNVNDYIFKREIEFSEVQEKPPVIISDNEIETYLSMIDPNQLNYGEWFELLCAVKNVVGDEPGLILFDSFNKKSKLYDENGLYKIWVTVTQQYNYTIGTIKYWAKKHSPVEYNKYKKKADHYCEIDWFENTSDVTTARYYEKVVADEIFYTESVGFVIYNKFTGIWEPNNKKNVLITPICEYFQELAIQEQRRLQDLLITAKEDDKKSLKTELVKMNKFVLSVGSSKWGKSIVDHFQNCVTKNDSYLDSFEKNAHLFAFSDGKVVDLQNGGIVRNATKEDKILVTCGYKYPERNDLDIELVENLLWTIFEDPDSIDSLLSALACSLYGSNINEIMVILTAIVRNGKGLIDSILQQVLGDYYSAADSTLLTTLNKKSDEACPSLAQARFARALMTTEPDTGKGSETLKISVIKKLTGGDIQKARFLYGQTFSFVPHFTTYLQANEIPDLSKIDEAIKQRLQIIPFPFTFVANKGQTLKINQRYRDEKLKEKIKHNDSYRNGLLHLLIDTWVKNNGKFYQSEKVAEFTNTFIDEQNILGEWFERNYTITDHYDYTSARDMKDFFDTCPEFQDIKYKQFVECLQEICDWKKDPKNKQYMFQCKRKGLIPRSIVSLTDSDSEK